MVKLKLIEFDQQFDHNYMFPNAATQITRLHEQTMISVENKLNKREL